MKAAIVEDHFTCRAVLKALLEKRGATAVMYPDGDAALAGIADGTLSSCDLVCLDLGLPGVSGLDVLAEIRKREVAQGGLQTARQRVLIVTAAEDASVVRDIFRAGADHCIFKPVSPRDLDDALVKLELSFAA